MKHPNIALTLAAAAVIVALGLTMVLYRSPPALVDASSTGRSSGAQPQAPDRAEPRQLAAASSARDQKALPRSSGSSMRSDLTDEDIHREQARVEAVQEISANYSLLIDQLKVTARQKNELISVLAADRVAATTKVSIDPETRAPVVVMRGNTVNEQERSQRIAAIIGDKNLREFVLLERHLPAYSEVQTIGSMLKTNGAPLTDAQRNQLLEEVIRAREQYIARPRPKVESIEDLERIEVERNEYERHVIELLPSVLSSKQITYVFDQYQYWSEQRARDFQAEKSRQQKRRARNPHEAPAILVPEV